MDERPLEVGDEVLPFSLSSQLGVIRIREFIDGKWCLLVTVGSACDPVATTEIGALSKLADEFHARNIAVVVVCCDTVARIRQWIRDIEELQDCSVSVPILSDTDWSVVKKYGCTKTLPPLYNTEVTSHGTFLVDVDKVVRLSMHYSPSIGRNIYEILRAFDALQLATHHKVICPSNWSQGQELFVHNAVPSDQAGALFPKGFVEIKPWFRVTPVPESTSSTA